MIKHGEYSMTEYGKYSMTEYGKYSMTNMHTKYSISNLKRFEKLLNLDLILKRFENLLNLDLILRYSKTC